MSNGAHKYPYLILGLIDSGCTMTNMNADFAEFFGIDLETDCVKISQQGVGGIGEAFSFKSTLTMSIKDHGSPFESPVIFTRGLPVPLLLGQNNFFDHFDIKFQKRSNTFELNRQ